MANDPNVLFPTSVYDLPTGTELRKQASDQISQLDWPFAKIAWGARGVAKPVSKADPLPVGGLGRVIINSFTRENLAKTYPVGSVIMPASPIYLNIGRENGGTGVITGVGIYKTGPLPAFLRLHLFRGPPGTSPQDGEQFAGNVSGRQAGYIGSWDVSVDKVWTDGASGFSAISPESFECIPNSAVHCPMIEVRAEYTSPASEIFSIANKVIQD